jgi:hypothetical protein
VRIEVSINAEDMGTLPSLTGEAYPVAVVTADGGTAKARPTGYTYTLSNEFPRGRVVYHYETD